MELLITHLLGIIHVKLEKFYTHYEKLRNTNYQNTAVAPSSMITYGSVSENNHETVTTSKGRAEHTSKAVKRQVAPNGG